MTIVVLSVAFAFSARADEEKISRERMQEMEILGLQDHVAQLEAAKRTARRAELTKEIETVYRLQRGDLIEVDGTIRRAAPTGPVVSPKKRAPASAPAKPATAAPKRGMAPAPKTMTPAINPCTVPVSDVTMCGTATTRVDHYRCASCGEATGCISNTIYCAVSCADPLCVSEK